MRARRRSGWIGSRRSAGKGGVVKGELSATAGGDCAGGFIRRSFLFYLQTRVPTVLPVWSESWRAPCRGGALEMVGFKEKPDLRTPEEREASLKHFSITRL